MSVSRERDGRWDSTVLFFLLVGIVFISRLPFLDAGYGTQPDAWRVAMTARSIALTGEYSASRLPGYPLHELVCSLFWRGGPWVLNGLTALFSGIAGGFFALSLKRLGSHRYILGGLALSFVPVIYVNSTMSLDNVWALAFILAALYFVLVNRTLVAGICLGVAIGCRITSAAMMVPMVLLLAHGNDRQEALQRIFKLCVPATIIGAAAFAIVFATYGPGFFRFSEHGYPAVADIIRRATVDVWGVLGIVGLLAAMILFVINSSKLRSIKTDSSARIQLLAWLVAIAIYTIAYLRLPHQSRYLIPAVPFIILALETILTERSFSFVCIILLFSSFIGGAGRSGLRPGAIFSEYTARKQDMVTIAQVAALGDAFPNKAVVVSGWWLPKIEGTLFATSRGMTDYVYLLDATELRKRLGDGFALYYLPGIREYNTQVYGVDLAKFGAKPLLPDGTPTHTARTRP